MPGLPKAGVQLIAEGASRYFGDLARGVTAQNAFATASGGSASAVNAFGGAAAKNAAKVAQLTDKLSFQKRAFDILQRELDETKAKYGEGSTQAQKQQLALDKLAKGIDKTTAELNKYQSGAESAGKASSTFGQIITGAMREAGAMVLRFAVDAGRAVLRFAGDMLKGAGDYEQAMNVMQAQSSATDAQMEQVRATAKALGGDLTLPAVSAADAGTAMLELSKGGLSVEQSMAAAKGTLQLAAAAETDVATAANIMTGALAAFGMEGDKAVSVADLLTNAANKSRASINDVSLGFQQAAFRFHSAGQGADDLAAALTVLIQAGLGGSDAGTALQNAIARLQGPTDKAAKLMYALGINVYDTRGNMLPLEKIITVLNGALGGMTQQQRNAALQTIFLSDGMKAIIPLLDAGADGFAKTKAEMNEQGTAAKMAAAQMQGMLGAAQGLTSQLETLALEGLEPLLPLITAGISAAAKFAGSFVGQVGPAVLSAIDFFDSLGHIISNGALPAFQTLAAASGLYALITLPSLITAVTSAVAAFGVANAAMLAALGPLALIAVAIAGVIEAANALEVQIDRVTDRVLTSSAQWQAAVKALKAYDDASESAQQGAQEEAAALQTLQAAQRTAIEQYALHTAAYQQFNVLSGHTQASLEAERLAINARGEAIVAGTAALDKELRLYGEIDGRREAIEQMTAAHEELSGAVQANAIDYDALAAEIADAFKAGAKAVGDYVNTATAFEAELLKAVLAGNTEQAQAAAANYAEQAAAARASMGEQLAAFTLAYARMNGVSDETTRAILRQIESTFGTTGDIAASTMLDLEGDIKRAMESGGSAIDGLGQRLDATTEDAIDLKSKMDALKGQYEAELIQNFKDGKIDVDQLRKALAAIPARVYSEVTIHTKYTSSGDRNDRGGGDGPSGFGGRALGGPVMAGTPYIVGEHRPEVFVPESSGRIVPSLAAFDRRYRPPMGRGERGVASVSSYQGPSYQWTINNPQPQAVDSLAALVRIQQLLYA